MEQGVFQVHHLESIFSPFRALKRRVMEGEIRTCEDLVIESGAKHLTRLKIVAIETYGLCWPVSG